MRSKFGNRKVTVGGETFDSMREYNRWCSLKLLQRAGKISELKRQVKFVLIPAQRDQVGKLVEREVSYVADFVYVDMDRGVKVVEDAKGYRTEVYKIKKKLMLWVHGIRIKES